MPRKLLLPLIIIAVALAAVVLLYTARPEPARRASVPEPVIQVETSRAQFGQHRVTLPSRGLLKPLNASTLAAQVSGEIVAVENAARPQGQFKKGDLLLRIDDRNYRAALRLAEAELQEAEVALSEERARSEQARRDWERLNGDESANPLVLREPQLAAAEARAEAARAQRDRAQLDLERSRIHAPFDGASTALHANLGQYVSAGSPLVDIVGLTVLEVALPISARWRHLLAEDIHGLDIALTDESGARVEARAERLAPVIDGDSRQLHLIARLDASGGNSLPSGAFVNADIPGRTLDDVVVLPREALVDGEAVWRIEDERLYKTPVQVVWQSRDEVVISGGIEEDDLINITPLAKVVSGTRVSLIGEDDS
ncbi:MAG: efflux RND transporter periplasmic adaptor subunit [Pseudomonadota bacterium]